MQKYALSQLTEETLNALVTLKEQAEISKKWSKHACPSHFGRGHMA